MGSTLLINLTVWFLLNAAGAPLPQKPQANTAAPAQYSANTNTRSPHGNLNLPCQNCHTFTAWKPIRSVPEFDHNQTKFPLRGMHEGVACRQCHTDLVFSNASTKCADCHADIHRRQFGASCENCHNVKGWRVSVQNIQQHFNRFPLVGAHALLQCDSCHKNAAVGQFQGLSTDCLSCHAAQFQQASNPNHAASGFPATCQACHSMDTWFGAKFDHLRFTGFALTGMHASLDCTACHVGGRFKGTPVDCLGCHAKDWATTSNPNHINAGFPTSCGSCHNTSSWMNVNFNHAMTGWPLSGAHAKAPCSQCHVNGRYTAMPTTCSSCHMADFQKTTNPNHVAGGFPTDCSICHSTVSWANATFNHALSGFPLTGAHATLQCQACHTGGQFTNLSTQCVSCHLKDFQGTNNPNHTAAGFPQQCQVCHTTTAWTPASFNHNTTPFPLTGAHTTVPCASCHINGQFAGTPTDCYSCHKADYQSTTNPNHAAAAFPTTCALCHNTTSWAGATFNHTWFPIYSGTHAGVWTTCATCHINPSNYAAFSCINCHTHSQANTDPNHSGVPNYVYNATSCYSCHPSGQGGN
ncbi:MAG TPA: hypothetical protein VJP04_02385 [Terriglobales bacterium]|nr:hypothetical protein [Terriglobales bacterium]